MSTPTIFVVLTKTPTELFKILKFEGLVASGAEAKQAISDGLVFLNGKVETRKRKKIVAGDEIQFLDSQLTIR
jgi:ribosome-associated protein